MGKCSLCCTEKKLCYSQSCIEQNSFKNFFGKSNKILPFLASVGEETLPTEHDIDPQKDPITFSDKFAALEAKGFVFHRPEYFT